MVGDGKSWHGFVVGCGDRGIIVSSACGSLFG